MAHHTRERDIGVTPTHLAAPRVGRVDTKAWGLWGCPKCDRPDLRSNISVRVLGTSSDYPVPLWAKKPMWEGPARSGVSGRVVQDRSRCRNRRRTTRASSKSELRSGENPTDPDWGRQWKKPTIHIQNRDPFELPPRDIATWAHCDRRTYKLAVGERGGPDQRPQPTHPPTRPRDRGNSQLGAARTCAPHTSPAERARAGGGRGAGELRHRVGGGACVGGEGARAQLHSPQSGLPRSGRTRPHAAR